MVYQPATGARDLLPLDVARQRWLEQRLEKVFHRWGYQEIITPTIEKIETLIAGGALRSDTLIHLRQGDGETLGLRPELTASIARAAVTRMAGVTLPQRLYYKANVFRRSPLQGISAQRLTQQQEFFQTGVELIGGGGLAADAEILLIVQDCVHHLGLSPCYLLLGDAGLTQMLLGEFPPEWQGFIRHNLACLDRVALDGLPAALRNRALALFDLRGAATDVCDRLEDWPLSPPAQERLHQLRALIQLMGTGDHPLPLTLDLSLIQSFDYYTGIVFDVMVQTETELTVVAQGGRYDQLLGTYHPDGQSTPGIGFVFNLDELEQALLRTGHLAAAMNHSQWLVIPTAENALSAAFAHAQTLRLEGTTRVEVALDMLAPEQFRAYARDRGIPYLAWVDAQGRPQVEALTMEMVRC